MQGFEQTVLKQHKEDLDIKKNRLPLFFEEGRLNSISGFEFGIPINRKKGESEKNVLEKLKALAPFYPLPKGRIKLNFPCVHLRKNNKEADFTIYFISAIAKIVEFYLKEKEQTRGYLYIENPDDLSYQNKYLRYRPIINQHIKEREEINKEIFLGYSLNYQTISDVINFNDVKKYLKGEITPKIKEKGYLTYGYPKTGLPFILQIKIKFDQKGFLSNSGITEGPIYQDNLDTEINKLDMYDFNLFKAEKKGKNEESINILKTRLAKGEISIEEYEKLKKILEE